MSGVRVLAASIGLALNTAVLYADTTLQLSTAHLTAESADVVVTHDHDVTQRGEPGARSRGEITLELNSTLRIVRKSDDAEISKQAVMPLTALTSVDAVMPLTALTSVDGGMYFAGLSSLKTLASKYNFLLVTPDGRIVATALITPTSGHCRAVSASTTNSIRWFDENALDVTVRPSRGSIEEIVVVNPYDRDAQGTPGECVIRPTAPDANAAQKP